MPKYHKLQRGVCLALFLISSIASYFNPHMIYIAGLSLLGLVSNDIICFLRDKCAPKEDSKEIKELQSKFDKIDEEFKSIKGDIGIAKIGAVIRRG